MSEERYTLNKQLAQMLKGGVIMDVTTPQQAKIAEEAGAIFRQMDDADMSYNREDCVNRKGFYIINCPENKMGW